jgi:predicted MFS family arabinose efflux permease
LRVYANVYLDTVLAVPTALIGGISATGQLLGLLALVSPLVIARFGQRRTIIYALLGLALIFLPIIAIAHWTAVGFSFIGMIALVSLIGPAFGVYSQSNVAAEWRTSIASAMTMAFGVGIALTALGGGQIVAASGFQKLFLVAAVAPLLGAILFGGYTYRETAVSTPSLQALPKSQ